jgi:hypothetical protein
MDTPTDLVVEIVAKGDGADEWQMLLFEQGPWEDVTREMLRFQERLYDCVDAVIDGHVAAKFPDSRGGHMVIRVYCSDLPKAEVAAFFERFSNGIFRDGDYRAALEQQHYVSGVSFAINFDHVQ